MFDTLADRIREDEHKNKTEQIVRYLAIILISVLLFGGLYFVVQHLE